MNGSARILVYLGQVLATVVVLAVGWRDVDTTE